MASRRPRLVEEGSPVGYGDAAYDTTTTNDDDFNNNKIYSNSSRYGGSTAASGRGGTSLTSANTNQTKRFHTGGGAGGVRTRLVIGGDDAHGSGTNGVSDGIENMHDSHFGIDKKQHYPGGGRGGVRTRLVIGGDEEEHTYTSRYNEGYGQRSFQQQHQQQHYHHQKQQSYQQQQHSPPFKRTDGDSTPSFPTAGTTTMTTYFPPSSNLSYENDDMDMDDQVGQHHHHQHQYHRPQAHHQHDAFQQQQHHQINEQQHYFNQPSSYHHNQSQPYQQQQPSHFHHQVGQEQQQNFFPSGQHDPQQQQHYNHHQQQHYHHQQQNHSTATGFPPSLTPPPQTHTTTPPPPPQQQEPALTPSNSPLIVIDGANIAYNYADASSSSITPNKNNKSSNEPNVLGIEIVVNYFKDLCRVSVVLPATWMRSKPNDHDANRENAMMETQQLETLQYLKSHGYLCMAPPRDDDDAYVLAIARKADEKGLEERQKLKNSDDENKVLESASFENMDEGDKNEEKDDRTFYGRGYVLSADFFRDAIQRDERQRRKEQPPVMSLKRWLEKGNCDDGHNGIDNRNGYGRSLSDSASTGCGGGPGRISYSFYNAGSTDTFGNAILDFVPNPRHPLVEWIERKRRRMGT